MGLFLAAVQRARRNAYSAKVISTMEMQNAWEQSFGSTSAMTVIRRLGVEQTYWSLLDGKRWADVPAETTAKQLFAMLVIAAEEERKKNIHAQLIEVGVDGNATGYRVSLSLATLCHAFGDQRAQDMINKKVNVTVNYAEFRRAIDMAPRVETPEVEFTPPLSHSSCL